MDLTPHENSTVLIDALNDKIEKYKKLEKEYQGAIQALKRKEQFNFTLFQFNPSATIIVDRDGRVIKSNMAKKRTGDRLPRIGDVMYRDYASKHVINMYQELMDSINDGAIKSFPQLKYGNKILSITIAPFPDGAIITSQDVTRQIEAENDNIHLIRELRRALQEVEQLRNLLPICASCKKIRDDSGYWNDIEVYFQKHGNLNFSHAMCPECVEKLYPDVWESIKKRKAAANK